MSTRWNDLLAKADYILFKFVLFILFTLSKFLFHAIDYSVVNKPKNITYKYLNNIEHLFMAKVLQHIKY